MGFFDERILAALKDGKPKGFATLLGEVGFSHNTLQQHLERLTAKGLVLREKPAANGFGRPKFAYHIASRTTKQVTAALEDPRWSQWSSLLVASGMFVGSRKAVTAKKQGGTVRLKFALKSENKDYNHFTPIKGTSQRLSHITTQIGLWSNVYLSLHRGFFFKSCQILGIDSWFSGFVVITRIFTTLPINLLEYVGFRNNNLLKPAAVLIMSSLV